MSAPVQELSQPADRPYRPEAGPDVGVGYAPAHHGELLQGMFRDPAGQPRRALVTLPQPGRGTRAAFHPSYSHGGVLGPPEMTKVRRAAMLTLRAFANHPAAAKGGRVEISSNIPRGVGMGSSTSDVTATIRAVADFHGVQLAEDEVARLAVLAECASDSIMIDDRVVLFAHRDGVVLETFGHRLPPMFVLSCDTEPAARVDTLRLRPADYDESEVANFGVLRAALRRAVALADTALLGRVATASARINQRYLPKPHLELLVRLCLDYGGCGIQVAHSGTVAGLLFDALVPDAEGRLRRCAAELHAAAAELGIAVTGLFGVSAAFGDGSAADLQQVEVLA
ncbi:GHMP kinase [Jatrophihabitans sp.]|uniref:GHMP family kinase ATP-binding protein n=1 Tax=Jatrophihabitans sp. TaxID=1932789 RepID=UPI002C6F5202|nr:hypothetical protein [Jatrophihabitans sp.]